MLLRVIGYPPTQLSLGDGGLGVLPSVNAATVTVAIVAGVAGTLAFETRSSSAAGVATSVTTIPAAAYLGATAALPGEDKAIARRQSSRSTSPCWCSRNTHSPCATPYPGAHIISHHRRRSFDRIRQLCLTSWSASASRGPSARWASNARRHDCANAENSAHMVLSSRGAAGLNT